MSVQIRSVMKQLERGLFDNIGRHTGANHEAAIYLAYSEVVTAIACLDETKAALERMMKGEHPADGSNVVRGVDFSRARAPR